MKRRCKHLAGWKDRGFTYPPEWESFEGFLADMGECPDSFSLERRDNNQGYSKNNCKWAGYSEQNLNRRTPKNNTSGVKGVSLIKVSNVWFAYGKQNGKTLNLYTGKDFFQAVCARKSWEATCTCKEN